MKRFIMKVLFAASVGVVTLFVILVLNVSRCQKQVRVAFCMQEGADVLCLGNSHVGRSIPQLPELHNRVIWTSATSFICSLMRLKEMERLNQLENVKTCIVDFDHAGLLHWNREAAVERWFLEQLPFSWRYVEYIPLPFVRLSCAALTQIGHHRAISATFTSSIERKWLDRSEEERARMLAEEQRVADTFHERGISRDVDDVIRRSVIEMKRICDEHNIRLIFFASPLVPGHPDRPDSGLPDLIEDYVSFSRGLGLEFYDCRKDAQYEDFRDASHLHYDGARKFAKDFFGRLGLTLGCEL